MKRIILGIVALVLLTTSVWAASEVVAEQEYLSPGGNVLVLKLTCISHTDGTFTNTSLDQILSAAALSLGVVDQRGRPTQYWRAGYVIADVWTENDSTAYPTSGAVTITDGALRQVVGTAATDALTLATTSNGVGYLVIERGSGQRVLTKPLRYLISDTGTGVKVFVSYIVLRKG